jgi:hypothetical protein
MSACLFSMQKDVIPFKLQFQSFLVAMFVMMCAIFAMQWLMKRWTLFYGHLLWEKMKKVIEQHQTEVSHGLGPDETGVAETHRYRGGIDLDRGAIELQGLETRMSLNRNNISPV